MDLYSSLRSYAFSCSKSALLITTVPLKANIVGWIEAHKKNNVRSHEVFKFNCISCMKTNKTTHLGGSALRFLINF